MMVCAGWREEGEAAHNECCGRLSELDGSTFELLSLLQPNLAALAVLCHWHGALQTSDEKGYAIKAPRVSRSG